MKSKIGLLAVLAAVLMRKPTQLVLLGAAAVFAGLIAAYALAMFHTTR